MGKNKTKNNTKSGEALRTEALAVPEGNLVWIEAQERDEATAAASKDGGAKTKTAKGGKTAKQPKPKRLGCRREGAGGIQGAIGDSGHR